MNINCATNYVVNKRIAEEGHDAGLLQGRGRTLSAHSCAKPTRGIANTAYSSPQGSQFLKFLPSLHPFIPLTE